MAESFKNRVLTDSYEPGSTFKMIPLALMLESKKYDLNHIVN